MSFDTPASLAHRADVELRRRIANERATAPEPTDEQIRQYLERTTKTVEQEAAERRNNEIAAQWVASHPEYRGNQQSGVLMEEFLTARGLSYNEENLTAAFNHLSQKNLIETNQAAVQEQVRKRAVETELQRRARILAEEQRSHTTEELYEMPLENLRELVQNNW